MIGARLQTYVSYLFATKALLVMMVEEDDRRTLNVRVVRRLEHGVDMVFRLHHQSFGMNNHHYVCADEMVMTRVCQWMI